MKLTESLRVLVRVVERGSFLAVANELGTTQPRITRLVQALESEFGTRLFERSTRGLVLTPGGERAYRMAQQVLSTMEAAHDDLRQERGELDGRLRVVAPMVFGDLVLADCVAAFHAKHPEVRVELLLSDRNVNLIEEGAHCAFRGGVLDDSSLVAVPLGFSVGLFAATSAYLKRHGAPRKPADLTHHSIAAFHPRTALARYEVVRLSAPSAGCQVVPVQPRVWANTSQAAARVAAGGDLLAVLPHYGIDWYSRHLGFEQVLRGWCTKPNPIHAIYPSKHGITARTRAFVEFVAQRTHKLLKM
jgi:DNA-binding transcriptional LysR family regulator